MNFELSHRTIYMYCRAGVWRHCEGCDVANDFVRTNVRIFSIHWAHSLMPSHNSFAQHRYLYLKSLRKQNLTLSQSVFQKSKWKCSLFSHRKRASFKESFILGSCKDFLSPSLNSAWWFTDSQNWHVFSLLRRAGKILTPCQWWCRVGTIRKDLDLIHWKMSSEHVNRAGRGAFGTFVFELKWFF